MKCKRCGKETDFLNKNGVCEDCMNKSKNDNPENLHAIKTKHKNGTRVALIIASAAIVAGIISAFLIHSFFPQSSGTQHAVKSIESGNQESSTQYRNIGSESSQSSSEMTSSEHNYSSAPSSSQIPTSNGSPYTSPPILGSATTPLTRGLDSGYTTASNITAPGIDFIGGIRQNTDGSSTIDLWILNNTSSVVLGGFMVRIPESNLRNVTGDFYIDNNDAVAVSTQHLNAGYQENVQIHINSMSKINELPIRMYTQKGTTKLATMTIHLES